MNPSKSASLRDASHVNNLVVRPEPDFPHESRWICTRALEVAFTRLGDALRARNLDERQLNSFIAILGFRFPLHHNTRSHLEHSGRNRVPVFLEHLSHSEFFPEYAVYHVRCPR